MGSSPAMQRLYKQLRSIGQANSPALLVADKGTETESCARALHDESTRSSKPFESRTAAGLTQPALAAALEALNGGTLHLSEIESLPTETVPGLLEFLRTGNIDGRKLAARLVASAEGDIDAAAESGAFDPALKIALEVARIQIPKLRDRGEDVLDLADHLLSTYSREVGRSFTGLDDEVQVAFVNYPWPENRAELDRTIRGIVQSQEGRLVTRGMLPKAIAAEVDSAAKDGAVALRGLAAGTIRPLWQVEKEEITKALKLSEGNVLQAARLLEISPATIYRKQQTWKAMKS